MTPEQKLKKIATIYETTRKTKVKGLRKPITVSSHAGLNLEGAIITIEHHKGQCDKTSMRTLKRVARQLGRIAMVLGERE